MAAGVGPFAAQAPRGLFSQIVAPAFIDSGQAYDHFVLEDVDGDGREDLVRAAGGLAMHWGCQP